MADAPYARFNPDDLILRDELAVDRTLLANERTLLAYLRSAVALLIAGGSMIHFASAGWFMWLGVACLPAGGITGVIGVMRFARMYRAIAHVRRKTVATPPRDTAA
ncbi:MAG: DUF202 domain-containing protein [Planctomycetota bacterium]